jgi:Uma2 family endonuclease
MMPTTKATYADLAALPEHQVGELIAGTLYTWPRPRPSHGLASGRTFTQLDTGADDPSGWHIRIEPELRLLNEHIVVPDLAGWRRADVPVLPDDVPLDVLPAWVCEIASPSTARHDRTVKMPLYAQAGVAWLWLLDPATRILEVFQAMPAGWLLAGTYPDDVRSPIPPFEHVTFDLAALWR